MRRQSHETHHEMAAYENYAVEAASLREVPAGASSSRRQRPVHCPFPSAGSALFHRHLGASCTAASTHPSATAAAMPAHSVTLGRRGGVFELADVDAHFFNRAAVLVCNLGLKNAGGPCRHTCFQLLLDLLCLLLLKALLHSHGCALHLHASADGHMARDSALMH